MSVHAQILGGVVHGLDTSRSDYTQKGVQGLWQAPGPAARSSWAGLGRLRCSASKARVNAGGRGRKWIWARTFGGAHVDVLAQMRASSEGWARHRELGPSRSYCRSSLSVNSA